MRPAGSVYVSTLSFVHVAVCDDDLVTSSAIDHAWTALHWCTAYAASQYIGAGDSADSITNSTVVCVWSSWELVLSLENTSVASGEHMVGILVLVSPS